ncbi:MAG: 6-phosphogluconolactonase [Candidatus Hydrogenedentes bacterium]|nr:6-phosphogluconolactonase [Candidatus Hydrogenedentota bacterium]
MSTHIHLSENPARDLARRFADQMADSGGGFVAVSGGATPTQLYRTLVSDYAERVDWQRITLFQVDERCVPVTHADSNWRVLHDELLSKLPALKAHRIEAERIHAADDYETRIVRTLPQNTEGIPVFDLILLGMGPDGHTASLFPSTQALHERNHFVVLNDVPQLKTQRVTMTYPILNAARQRWFLVSGADKADAFARVQEGDLPAGRIADAEWFIDPSVAG